MTIDNSLAGLYRIEVESFVIDDPLITRASVSFNIDVIFSCEHQSVTEPTVANQTYTVYGA